MRTKVLFFAIFCAFLLFQGCTSEENASTLTSTSLSARFSDQLPIVLFSVVDGISFNDHSLECDGTTARILVQFNDSNLKESAIKSTREFYGNLFTIHRFQTSERCPNIEVWTVDCEEYLNYGIVYGCGSGCDDHDHGSTGIERDPEIDLNSCFGIEQ